jgi:DNA replication protein DnaC
MAGYYFNLPQITQLTISQQAALNETKQIALSGGPGTGKSVVSLWRHISNYQRNKKSLLLTYTTTLARYLSECCTTQRNIICQLVQLRLLTILAVLA